MAEDVQAVAANLIMRLRKAEKLAIEGKASEAQKILKEVLREAREKGLEKSLRNLTLRVKALLKRQLTKPRKH